VGVSVFDDPEEDSFGRKAFRVWAGAWANRSKKTKETIKNREGEDQMGVGGG